jgi:NADH-quinone oxidoreductase subunit E
MAPEINAEDQVKLENLRKELKTVGPQRRQLIPALQMAQRILSYLPPQAIALVAASLDISPTEVYGVATFYNQFRLNPPGRHPVRVCLGTACHIKGGEIILEHLERKLDIREGETTPDLEFSINRVACVGCCALAPVALVGETVHGKMMTSKVEGLILRIQIEKEKAERAQKRNDPQ